MWACNCFECPGRVELQAAATGSASTLDRITGRFVGGFHGAIVNKFPISSSDLGQYLSMGSEQAFPRNLAISLSPSQSRQVGNCVLMVNKVVRVRLEPELEIQAATLTSDQRRRLARLYYRWAKQLYVSADLLDLHAGLWPERSELRRGRLSPQQGPRPATSPMY